MKFAFIHVEKACFPVEWLCSALDVSRSGYYAWTHRGPSRRAAEDARLGAAIASSHARSRGTYGSPRIHEDLQASGKRTGRKRVARLMKSGGIVSKRRRRFRATTDSKHAEPIAPNVLQRRFTVATPNTAWVGDVTYVWTWQGWLYLAVLIDLASRRVVGWATSENNDRRLALAALNAAVAARKPGPGLVHHTDRGSPYASQDYQDALAALKAIASMSNAGDCWDNAVAESFFGTLRGELLDHENYATRRAAEEALRDYIEGFYNTHRRHSSIGYISPIEMELRLISDRKAA